MLLPKIPTMHEKQINDEQRNKDLVYYGTCAGVVILGFLIFLVMMQGSGKSYYEEQYYNRLNTLDSQPAAIQHYQQKVDESNKATEQIALEIAKKDSTEINNTMNESGVDLFNFPFTPKNDSNNFDDFFVYFLFITIIWFFIPRRFKNMHLSFSIAYLIIIIKAPFIFVLPFAVLLFALNKSYRAF